MSILEAIILLARVVKQVADDSSSNVTTVQSLAARVESMVRVLQKIPDNTELDPGLLNRMHEHLKEAHRLIVKYDKKSSVLRIMSASSMKFKLAAVEAHIGKCIDDLSFNIGITSAAVLEGIRADLREAAEKDGMNESAALFWLRITVSVITSSSQARTARIPPPQRLLRRHRRKRRRKPWTCPVLTS
jgi:hypothetical protein